MRAPSVKALQRAFSISRREANLLRTIARAVDEPRGSDRIRSGNSKLEEVIESRGPEATQSYVRSLHSDPYDSRIWRVTVALHAMNEIVGGHGVEGLGPPRSGDYAPPYEYVNQGDPYVATLIYKRATDTLKIGDWGSIAERHPSWD